MGMEQWRWAMGRERRADAGLSCAFRREGGVGAGLSCADGAMNGGVDAGSMLEPHSTTGKKSGMLA